MEKITKSEFDSLVLNGIAVDMFIAERAYTLFQTIGNKSDLIDGIRSKDFFMCAQLAFKDQFLLAMARLFDSPSKRNKTRCILGLIQFISKNITRLPDIIQIPNLINVLDEIGLDKQSIKDFKKNGDNVKINKAIIQHFSNLLENSENKRLLNRLKEIRVKKLAHNEVTSTNPHNLVETLDVVTYKDLVSLLEISKNFIGVIGWAYMSTVFMHNGSYHLSQDAQRPKHSLIKIIEDLV
jgi:hypothetical protein